MLQLQQRNKFAYFTIHFLLNLFIFRLSLAFVLVLSLNKNNWKVTAARAETEPSRRSEGQIGRTMRLLWIVDGGRVRGQRVMAAASMPLLLAAGVAAFF